ncbi:MAG: tetratricopeptide repeat protein [Candidatus Poribacteria bacterium]|nr:tetratricopeptide repeat protein [Candidatus Poribacteria bacterium]
MKIAEKVLMFIGCLAVGILLSCGASVKQQATRTEKVSARPDLDQIAKIGKAATVQIGSLSVEGPPTLSSGFFIGQDIIVTNVHVINQKSFDGAVSIAKLVNKPTWYTIEGVMASDPKRDLVILKVAKVAGEDGHVLSLGDSETVEKDDRIVAIGNPDQDGKVLQGDVSVGWISRITPNFLDLRARNNRNGYSGGPVLNVHGEVIGITFQGHRVGAGYAIPSNYLRGLLKDISTQPKPLEKWREEPLVRYYSAVDAEERGEFKNAIEVYDAVIRLAPDFADAYINRGDVRKNLGDFEDAIKDYDTAIRLGDDYAYVYLNRGIAKDDLGDKKGALEDYNKAIFLDLAYVDAYLRRGFVKSNLGDEKGAISDFDTVIRLKPEKDALAIAYLNRGNAKDDLGDQKGTIEDCEAVIRLKPQKDVLAGAYLNRGEAKSDLGDKKGAIEDCNTVIDLEPRNIILAAAYNLRGEAKSDLGDNKGNIMDYDKAIQLEPNHPEFYYDRGVANADLGRTSAAETDFKTALKLLKKITNISESVSGGFVLHVSVRSGLKADIEKALRDLE